MELDLEAEDDLLVQLRQQEWKVEAGDYEARELAESYREFHLLQSSLL